MELLSTHFRKIPERFKFTFATSTLIGLLIHLYAITNEFINHDSVFNFYADKGSDGSGRFTIKYFKGLTSFFDLHYIQGVISIIFLAITIALLVDLFDLKSKWAIIPFSSLYLSYPTISGTFSYMFTSHAYFLSNLLTVLTVFLFYTQNKKWVSMILGSIFIYLSLGTYQINIAYGFTLILLLFIKNLILNEHISIKSIIGSMVTLILGLLAYIAHFKIYQKLNGLLDYNGINDAGKIDLEMIQAAHDQVFKDIGFYFFNDYNFERLFEILNVGYLALFIILSIVVCIVRKTSIKNIILVTFSIVVLPYILYMIYFISPDVEYHLIMKQHFALLFIVGIALFEVVTHYKNNFAQIGSIIILAFFLLTSYNQILISNIYYEKLSDLNKATDSLITRIAYDIQHLPGYTKDIPIAAAGNPSKLNLKIPDQYNLFTPSNVGVGSHIVYDFHSMFQFMKHETGFPNVAHKGIKKFLDDTKVERAGMPTWPAEGSIKIINGVIFINF